MWAKNYLSKGRVERRVEFWRRMFEHEIWQNWSPIQIIQEILDKKKKQNSQFPLAIGWKKKLQL